MIASHRSDLVDKLYRVLFMNYLILFLDVIVNAR